MKMAYDMDTTTEHIAVLHESGNHVGFRSGSMPPRDLLAV
jgi:hypothetical protein